MTELSSPVLLAQGLVKEFREGATTLRVLDGVDFAVVRGERIAVVGASGSGKTTLLQLLGGLDLPSAGEVHIEGASMNTLSDTARGQLRNRSVGFLSLIHI